MRKPTKKQTFRTWAKGHRKNLTYCEKRFRTLLYRTKTRFTSQKSLPEVNRIADFYVKSLNLVIEIDGKSHNDPAKAKKDRITDEILFRKGYSVLRITNRRVNALKKEELKSILETFKRFRRIQKYS